MRNTRTTILDFYQGAYGPTIRIDVQDIGWLKKFKDLIIQLKNHTIPEANLLNMDGVEKYQISELKLILGTYPLLSLTSTAQTKNNSSFLWTVTKDNLIYMISAIDQLVKGNEPGHYYLYDDNGLIIELAYKE